jgi:predicted site-specific integrase-resolvase
MSVTSFLENVERGWVGVLWEECVVLLNTARLSAQKVIGYARVSFSDQNKKSSLESQTTLLTLSL